MTSNWLSPLVRRLAVREWLSILVAMVLLAGVLGWQNGLGRLDQTLYDHFLSQNGRPARDDILIVSIDDYSLAQLGRWPWPRALHAELIAQIAAAGPRAIGLDVILSEPEPAQANGASAGDLALANALRQNQRTVLPVVMTNAGAGLHAALPTPGIAKGTRAFGHINLEHDNDGVVRSVYLYEGQNDVWWPHFSLALLQLGNRDGDGSGLRHTSLHPAAPVTGESTKYGHWQRSRQMHIPFAGNNGHFRSIPYVSVLRGEVPPQFFADKYVLIGATALGMTDSYPTPVSGGVGAMAGIEINANILGSLLDGKAIAIAEPWQAALFSILPVLVAVFGYFLLSPRMALLLTAGMLTVTLASSYFALRQGIWLAPAAAMVTLLISYPLWSWRRLEAAIDYLGEEFMRLDQEPHVLPELASSNTIIEDVLERRMNAMENAARRVRDLRQFISDNLDSLPDATLVTTVDGHVLLANKHANQYFALAGHQDIQSALLPYLFSALAAPEPLNQTINTRFDWWQLLDLKYAPLLADGVSTQDQQGRDLLIKSAPCHSASNELTGWIVSVIDISPIRAAERSRDETLRFLSHDMRAPQASILALLELQHDPASALPQQELFARIEKACSKTLGLADNFVQLARAESHEYRLEEVDFQEMLYDATDEMWSLAKSKRIELATEILPGDYPVRADRSLMTRALVNLLSNAINYSPADTRVTCSIELQETLEGPQVMCSISDQGFGIAPHDQLKLFRRFQRLELPNQPRHEGIGLGLVFVKTVVERHLGEIRFASKVGEGTTFTIVLPSALPG